MARARALAVCAFFVITSRPFLPARRDAAEQLESDDLRRLVNLARSRRAMLELRPRLPDAVVELRRYVRVHAREAEDFRDVVGVGFEFGVRLAPRGAFRGSLLIGQSSTRRTLA